MAEGQIGSVLATRVCNATASDFPTVAHVHGNIYAIVWDQGGTDGLICTVNISTDGLTITLVDGPDPFRAVLCLRPRIIKVAPNYFALVYTGPGTDGYIQTCQISDAGSILDTYVTGLEFDTTECVNPEICEVTTNVFVVAYTDTNDDGKIVTIGISDVGLITSPVLDEWVFQAGTIKPIDVLKVGANVFAFFFGDVLDDGWVKTIGISDGGGITKSIIDFLNYETASAVGVHAAHFTGNIYAAAYQGTTNPGWVSTIAIEPNGQIAASRKDQLNFSLLYGLQPTILRSSLNVLAIAYMKSANAGNIYTFWCLYDGDITTAPVDTLEYDNVAAGRPFIFHVTGNIFAVAYTGASSYITLKTFDILTPAKPQHLHMMGMA